MLRNLLFVSLFTALFCTKSSAQNRIVVKKDSFLDTLLVYKKKINDELKANRPYKIQIYSGSKTEADKTLIRFRRYFGTTPSEIVFETPNYKVRVGNYPTRLEADRELLIYKRKFQGAFIF